MANKRIKIAGYAKRIFFNDNIEYRNFSPDLVGFQLTSEGGTTLFTNGNFSISANLDPKPDVLFTQGTKSKFYTLDDVSTSGNTQIDIQNNLKVKLNIDITNPLSYVWYGSASEMIRSSLLDIEEKFPAAIYVDNKVGSVTGNNITNYVYDISTDTSTFNVNSNFFVNPFNIKYTLDSKYVSTESNENPLRNLTLKYTSYVIEHNGIIKNIKSLTPSTQKTNSEITLVVEGNPFPELTGIILPQFSFLMNSVDASIPYFIKPNESEIEKFFSGLDDFQRTILNREISPKYRAEIISSNYTDDGVLLTSKKTYDFPILSDGYNLNFFDTYYLSYLDKLTKLGENLDEFSTDIIVRKYTTEAINSFDTLPSTDGEDLTLNGEKATKLLRIYGVEFDYIKKYIDGIKLSHVVTYNKKNNTPDALIKDLSYMLGLEPINFINDATFSKLYLPSNGNGLYSGTSVNLTQQQIDIELYRRLILNIAWLWKSKGSRKAVEFLFRFIGAPESLVNFNEYIVIVDKPLDMDEIKRLLYIYTGDVDTTYIPYDDNGYPYPPKNGDLVINSLIDPNTGLIVENEFSEMYFQKAGGWYRQTYGDNSTTILKGNNPHVGSYDGGSEYLQYFSKCYIPNFNLDPTIVISGDVKYENYFVNYNYGIFNGIPSATTFYTTQLTYNPSTKGYQPIDKCLDVNYSIIETPLQNDGKTTLQQAFSEAKAEYDSYLEKIKVDKYLMYSPEWFVIKNNYDLSLKNCLNEVSTENCDINKTLEICLNEIPVNPVVYDCNNLTLQQCSPFYYYTDTNGNKISFDEFPQCCSSNGSRYVSYVNEYGRRTEYCSEKAPCVGEPFETWSNGIVSFKLTNKTILQDIFYNGDLCYQYTYKNVPISDFKTTFGYTPTEVFFDPNLINIPFNQIFTRLNSCNPETIISSPECCAWYGYDYSILDDGTDKYIVCVDNNNNQINKTEFISVNDIDISGYYIPKIDYQVNSTYVDLQNPVGGVYNYYSTDIFWDCFVEGRIIKEVVNENSAITVIPNSILNDTSLMDPSNWEVHAIDEYGRVSFIPKIFDNNFILDWYSDSQLILLYQQIALFYGYTFADFTIDYNNNTLILYNGDNSYSLNPNSVFSAAVDPNRIGCSDIKNVSIVFGSENWQGFKLPDFPTNSSGEKIDDCNCTINFSFDYMLKYNTKNLIECADNTSCYPAIINDNTISNINCLNFAVFTNSEDESKLLEGNFNDRSDLTEEYIIWNNTNILEPNIECCTAIGGNVISVTQWESVNQKWVSEINKTFEGLYNPTSEFLLSLNFSTSSMIDYVKKYNEINDYVNNIIENNECFNFDIDVSCEIDYSNYINSNDICNLEIPLECGIWAKLLQENKILKNKIEYLIDYYNRQCPSNFTKPNFSSSYLVSEPKIVKTRNVNSVNSQIEKELNNLKNEESKLNTEIENIENEIIGYNNDNVIIQKALTNVNSPLDCTVYDVKINEIRNFDYSSYCNSIVYGNPNLNDGSKQNEYKNCVDDKTIENQNDEILFTNLFKDCQLKNSLTKELDVAIFNNDLNLIDALENEISDINQSINDLTTDYNNSISYNESLQSSVLLTNDIVNTINRIAELLNTTVDSITDSSGNLILSEPQKVTLNIIYNSNLSVVSNLQSELDDKNYLLTDNLNEQKDITNQLNNGSNNIGGLILGWGIGLIGLYYTIKGYIDPEILGYTMAFAPLPIGMQGNNVTESTYTQPKCEFTDINLFSTDRYGNLSYDGNDVPVECCNSEKTGLAGEFYIGNSCMYISNCCVLLDNIKLDNYLYEINQDILDLEKISQDCHDKWRKVLISNYKKYETTNNSYFDNYLDNLKVNFKLFVNNTNIDTQTNIDTGLTYLPYTENINPIWEWDPTNGYSGVILEGSDSEIATIEDGIFNHLSKLNIPYNSDMFEPSWQTLNFTLPECVCYDLRKLYPNKEFFFSIELENYECSLCLLVDNIKINISDCETQKILTYNDCLIPELSCVIDNKKSWVYYDDGVIKQTVYPNGECNTGSTSNYEIIKLGKEQERLWLDLEYRYTDYSVKHSDLILNVKNTTFSIDPAKAIECDVFNYWKNIDCDNCPTKCMEDSKIFEDGDDLLFQDCNTYIFEDQSTQISLVFSGEVLNSGYTLNFDDVVTTGLTFNCSTYTNILQQQILQLKNKYYSLTSDYNLSLDATYQQLLDKGESLDKFYIQENNCGTNTLVINDTSSLNNLFAILSENYDGTISIYETYLYTGSTPYSGGVISEVLSGTGVTAQTFNQQLDIDQNCCETLNDLLNGEGATGLGLGKNYTWDSSNCFCTWKPLNGCDKCKGDCEYCGTKKECVNGFSTGDSYNVCINPLDYLDIQPSEINIKAVFDQLVQTNLIDVKSRQTISDYPLLRLFYELYLNANNCGKDLSGKFTYDTMFEFMDKIGDYWLDLLEQVVPATTIWEGCDNSGKIYRNTIFDQNKFNYKKYSLNFIDVDSNCPLSAYTDHSIGSETTYSLVEEVPIYPSSIEINQLKTDILNKEIEISVLNNKINSENKVICSLKLQDLSVPDRSVGINNQQNVIDSLNGDLILLNSELNELKTQLYVLEQDYIKQQENYYKNFMSCSGITNTLINAENSLSGFTQGTTSYERQINYISGVRDKYYKCVRKSNTLISDYNTIFITQIYDTNEYEGNVTIIGDPDWENGGVNYNKELIHNC